MPPLVIGQIYRVAIGIATADLHHGSLHFHFNHLHHRCLVEFFLHNDLLFILILHLSSSSLQIYVLSLRKQTACPIFPVRRNIFFCAHAQIFLCVAANSTAHIYSLYSLHPKIGMPFEVASFQWGQVNIAGFISQMPQGVVSLRHLFGIECGRRKTRFSASMRKSIQAGF